jgi:photosystem II stability/assembly factor-like uncharacterized protein
MPTAMPSSSSPPNSRNVRALVLVALSLSAAATAQAARWRVQFFHDEDNSRLQINDLKFCSPERGVAIGALIREGEFQYGLALVTRNGGGNWQMVQIREPGHALFCLDESHVWMAGRNGIWFSDEGGLSWRKLFSETGVVAVHFTSAERGFAVGTRKRVWSTTDSGKTWQRVEDADAPKTRADRSTYSRIAFATSKRGMIVGRSVPPSNRRESSSPIWLEPEPELRSQEPRITIMLDTSDGGEHWSASTVSMFGYISRVQLGADGRGLGLVEFDGTFAWPAEVHRLNLRTGGSERSLAEKGFAVTDIALVPGGPAYAAGYEAPGVAAWSPLPGRVRVKQSTDLSTWRELDVDYRAVAKRVTLALAPNGSVWLACDTGMILKLEP